MKKPNQLSKLAGFIAGLLCAARPLSPALTFADMIVPYATSAELSLMLPAMTGTCSPG